MSKTKKILIAFFVLLSGCGDDRFYIGGVEYRYMDYGGYQKVIISNSNPPREVVSPTVLGYMKISKGLFIVRQVVNFYECKNGDVVTEISDETQLFIFGEKYPEGLKLDHDKWKGSLISEGVDKDEIDALENYVNGLTPRRTRAKNCA